MNSSVTSWVADLIPDAISGMVNRVLSIKPTEELETFQECFFDTVYSILHVVEGTVTDRERAFVRIALAYFLPGGKKAALRRCLVHSLRGNWQSRGAVYIIVESIEGVDEKR